MPDWKYLLTLACLLLTRNAYALNIEGKEQAARTACLSSDYAKGVAILSELFVSTKDPVYIYNQGRCFEQNSRYQDAISRFQEYLRVGKKLGKSEKADAQKHISACQELLAQQDAKPAAQGEGRDSKTRAAKKACLNRDPTKGIELLTDLYVDTNDPIFIYNQGRCYEQNALCEDAIIRFREYLRKTPTGTESDRADVAKHIADCEALMAKQSRPAAQVTTGPTDPAPVRGQPAVDPTPDSARPVTPDGAVSASASDSAPGGGKLRAAGVLTMSAGGAFLVAGLALNLKHNGTIHDLQADYSGKTADSVQLYKTLAMVGYGAGAACLVGGAVMYWLGHRAGNATVVPTLVAGQPGMVWAGAF